MRDANISSLFYLADNDRPALRVGLLTASTVVASYWSDVIRDIAQCNFARICAVCMLPTHKESAAQQAVRANFLFDAYSRIDQFWFGHRRHGMDPVDCSAALAQVPRFHCGAIDQATARTLVDLQLDVVLNISSLATPEEVLPIARHGVWRIVMADVNQYRGGPAGFWELAERSGVSGASLQIVSRQPNLGLVLGKVLVPTTQGFSQLTNRIATELTIVPLVISALRDLHQSGWQRLLQRAAEPVPYLGQFAFYSAPTRRQIAKFALSSLGHALQRKVLPGRRMQWQIAVRRGLPGSPVDRDWSSFKPITRASAGFLADPFVVTHAGATWIFAERFDLKTARGVIACAQLADDGNLTDWRDVLERPYHLSFPNVFAYDGDMYMIPEGSRSGRVELFRAIEFPYRWQLDSVLWHHAGRDTVLHVDANRQHYFFTTLRQSERAAPQLFLFIADSLRGRWRLHPACPLETNARYARNAGALFWSDGALYRPSQDCVPYYGSGIHFHKIAALTPHEYRETLIGASLLPKTNRYYGTHSYARTDRWEVTDLFVKIG